MTPVKLNAMSSAIMVRELMGGGCTIRELTDETGLSRLTVGHYIRAMRAQHVLYIAGYEVDRFGAHRAPYYSLGEKKDAIRKPRITDKEKRERRKARKAMRLPEMRLAA